MTHKKTSWNTHLMKVWNDLKRKHKNATFSEAMKKAAKSYKGV